MEENQTQESSTVELVALQELNAELQEKALALEQELERVKIDNFKLANTARMGERSTQNAYSIIKNMLTQ